MTINQKNLVCPVCSESVTVSVTRNQNGLFMRCIRNGKHFRGFIMDKEFVNYTIIHAKSLGLDDGS